MTRIYFWRLWSDRLKRPWADRWDYSEPALARDHHSRAKDFLWIQSGTGTASVSDLYAENGARSVSIADGAAWEGQQEPALGDAPNDPSSERPLTGSPEGGLPADPASGPDIGWVGP